MTIKLGRKYLLLIVFYTFLWNQQAGLLSQKIAIENSYQQKVSSAVSRMLGQEKFLVIVSIEFSSVGGTLKKICHTSIWNRPFCWIYPRTSYFAIKPGFTAIQ